MSLTNFGPQIFQLVPAIVRRRHMAGAFALVAVLPANGANPFTNFAADQLHRQRQQNNFSQHVVQFDPFPS